MNPPTDLARLIARLSDGPLTADEAARLNELLRHDPAAQEAYLDHMAMDGLLERELGGAAPAPTGLEVAAKIVRGPWRSERGWGQMAAGLLVGAFLTSAVWACTLPLWSAARSKALPLVNGGFEEKRTPEPQGVPTRAGEWSGDFVEVTGPQRGVAPQAGEHMLRFLRADNAHSTHAAPVRAGELWQVIDLRPLRGMLGTGPVTLQLSGWFNGVPAADARYTCGVALVAGRGAATAAPALWKQRHEIAFAEADKEERLDGDPRTWQRVETQLTVPPDAELLLVQIRVYDKSARPEDGPSVFPANYADSIELRLVEKSAPRLLTRAP